MGRTITMFCLLFFSVAHASVHEHARRLAQQAQRTTQTISPQAIPGFTTATPPESALNDHHALEAATANAFSGNDAADFLRRSAETRPYFRLDLENDPLIENSEASVQDPEAVLANLSEHGSNHNSLDFKSPWRSWDNRAHREPLLWRQHDA